MEEAIQKKTDLLRMKLTLFVINNFVYIKRSGGSVTLPTVKFKRNEVNQAIWHFSSPIHVWNMVMRL